MLDKGDMVVATTIFYNGKKLQMMFIAIVLLTYFIIALVTFSFLKTNNIILFPTRMRFWVLYKNAKNKEINSVSNKKYILQWDSENNVFVENENSQRLFVKKNCKYSNCIVTSNRSYFGDLTRFDVIIFYGPTVVYTHKYGLPEKRSPHQKYVFTSIKPSHNYAVCSNRFDGFFNWTWTCRLDSDVRWGYFLIQNSDKTIVGPKKYMQWIKLEDMDPVNPAFKKELKSKGKAVAWLILNCINITKRMQFGNNLSAELQKYNLDLDVYGKCQQLIPTYKYDKMRASQYFFYLVFETSISEEHIMDKTIHAFKYNLVPIVLGGANYTQFLPPKSFLDARELGAVKLAQRINHLMKNHEQYADYFKWKKYYSYRHMSESLETNAYCQMCSLINDEEKVKTKSIVENFRVWWDRPKRC